MKLTIKTLSKSTFTIEIEPERTVKELKEKIEKEQGKDYPPSAQKLIYSGKILADENKMSEYEFDEKKFVVLMITRPPPPPKPAPEPAPAPASESKSKQTSDEKPKQAASSTATVSSAPPAETTPTTTATTTSASASQQNSVTSPTTTTELAARLNALNDASAALGVGEPQVAARLASMMSQPHFRQIQDLIQQSPHLLSSTIESLAASDPEMYNFMSDNPDIFVNALNHPPLAGSRRTNTSSSSMPSAVAAAAGQAPPGSRGGSQQAVGGPGGRQQPVVDSILHNVSEQDREAIERLKELGFSEYLAFQAYMACDKDEQLAANLLFQMDQ